MPKKARFYFLCISLIGLGVVVFSLWSLRTWWPDTLFLTLVLLTLCLGAANVIVEEEIAFDLGIALALSAVPLWGLEGAVLIGSLNAVLTSVRSDYHQWRGWQRGFEHLLFNIGVFACTAAAGGLVLEWGYRQGMDAQVGRYVLLWLVTAFVVDQLNLLLVAEIIYLTTDLRLRDIWFKAGWAIPINIVVTAVGGSTLAFAMRMLGVRGLLIFSLPILLTGYMFALYRHQTRKKLVELENTVEARTQDLLRLSEEKDAFLSVLAHDMRNILASIKLYASMLHDWPNLPTEKQQKFATIILHSERTLLEMVENIIEIEHLKTHEALQIKPQFFPLVPFIDEIIDSLKGETWLKQIEVQHLAQQPAAEVWLDRQKLGIIVANLFSNAIKYTPEGGLVTLSSRIKQDALVLSVQDSGPGIPADEVDQIFKRFHRVEKHRRMARGTGLGLAIVDALVKAHHGRIDVKSVEDVGSTFTVWLPLQTAAADDAETAA